ncbi:hypothetical protein A3A71_02790 [Candidatus Berkelbacteria bacterium RIFCSPLOWO2_01_FULL_50_28]|uniref:Uncharacterized protein n=1 Tax=Candidatus Berkelbacteria bacterium RIFCSPLOWO2_01_FULL_50_28 TaxID=1797471 RepID=A0A1F5EC10_9BACT|nr:MAG: hypothetical protein A2807_02325 [Candidatus Berkelbacteria bacterium RIFCSPHIGHO2_01_FULL_50_36]OGD62644.1 MAG: hypothetical protein A3F39_00340 [Candidatus Berkelbacteria bacterium RIFCSPHIGHO2_12_FULL_50_11]OGD64949.1 MAG: hypothetical protein A3A71_02790 [Candidatus Berkelbacteria bacterium RIFCSPLOWO2_01_FULL_50_28]
MSEEPSFKSAKKLICTFNFCGLKGGLEALGRRENIFSSNVAHPKWRVFAALHPKRCRILECNLEKIIDREGKHRGSGMKKLKTFRPYVSHKAQRRLWHVLEQYLSRGHWRRNAAK